jgi:hypothetical protein
VVTLKLTVKAKSKKGLVGKWINTPSCTQRPDCVRAKAEKQAKNGLAIERDHMDPSVKSVGVDDTRDDETGNFSVDRVG